MPSAEAITRHHDADPPEGESPWVAGGRPRTGIEVVDPDPNWPAQYAVLAQPIAAALGTRRSRSSTWDRRRSRDCQPSRVIDIDLTVPDSADEPSWLPQLEAAGFELRVREPWWHEHRCLGYDAPRANLHVFSPDCPELIRHRMYRSWLCEHPEDLALYREAKLGAASASNATGEHVMEYSARKEPVIRAIYDRAFRAAGLL